MGIRDDSASCNSGVGNTAVLVSGTEGGVRVETSGKVGVMGDCASGKPGGGKTERVVVSDMDGDSSVGVPRKADDVAFGRLGGDNTPAGVSGTDGGGRVEILGTTVEAVSGNSEGSDTDVAASLTNGGVRVEMSGMAGDGVSGNTGGGDTALASSTLATTGGRCGGTMPGVSNTGGGTTEGIGGPTVVLCSVPSIGSCGT